MKFSALNVDFNGPSLDFLGSRKTAHEGIKNGTPVKVAIFPMLASLSWKRLQISMPWACYRLSRISWALAQISCFTLALAVIRRSDWCKRYQFISNWRFMHLLYIRRDVIFCENNWVFVNIFNYCSFWRQDRAKRAWLLIKERSAALVSSSVPSARESGSLVTAGRMSAKTASSARSWSIPRSRFATFLC